MNPFDTINNYDIQTTTQIYLNLLFNSKTNMYIDSIFNQINFDKININQQCIKTGKTLLMYAAENNNEKYVNKLLNKGAYLDIIDKEGNVVRDYAINNKFWNINNIIFNKLKNNENIYYERNKNLYNKYSLKIINNRNEDDDDNISYDTSYSPSSSPENIPGSTGLNGYSISPNGYIGSCSNCNVSSYNMSYYK